MTREFRRPGADAGGVEVDEEVRAIARQYERLGSLAFAAYLVVLVGAPAGAIVAGRSLGALAILAVAYLFGGVGLFRVRSELDLVADRPPSAVRAEFLGPVTPVTALSTGRADRIDPVEAPGAVAAAEYGTTFLRVFSAEYRVAVTEGSDTRSGTRSGSEPDGGEGGEGTNRADPRPADDGPGTGDGPAGRPPIRLTLSKDGEPFSTIDVRVRGDDDRTRVSVEGRRRSRQNGLLLVTTLLGGRYQERVLDHYGYEVRDSDLRVGVLPGDGGE